MSRIESDRESRSSRSSKSSRGKSSASSGSDNGSLSSAMIGKIENVEVRRGSRVRNSLFGLP